MTTSKDSTECGECIAVRRFSFSEFLEGSTQYKHEWQMLGYAAASFVIIAALLGLLSFTLWKGVAGRYAWWFLYLIITIVITFAALWHINIHNRQVNSMLGMMLGMTVGMQGGVMLSVVIGSTNGMFMGSFFGMLFGLAVGLYAGKCCGFMGILQGAMAGVMGGTMGPMIALMMKTDHILWFMPPFMLVNVFILLGLSFLVYEQIADNQKKKPADFWTFFSACLIATAIFSIIMVYGYKSAFVA